MTITTEIEVPEELFQEFQEYLDTHQGWDQNRGMQAALSLFLLQNGRNNSKVSSLYLDSLFGGGS